MRRSHCLPKSAGKNDSEHRYGNYDNQQHHKQRNRLLVTHIECPTDSISPGNTNIGVSIVGIERATPILTINLIPCVLIKSIIQISRSLTYTVGLNHHKLPINLNGIKVLARRRDWLHYHRRGGGGRRRIRILRLKYRLLSIPMHTSRRMLVVALHCLCYCANPCKQRS